MDFDLAFERLIGHEGGYVNHPSDPGGETKWGVTERTAMTYGYTGDMHDLSRGRRASGRPVPGGGYGRVGS